MFQDFQQYIFVTQSDKKGLIAGKYMCSLNNMCLKFSISYYNSVIFIKLSINFYISGKSFKIVIMSAQNAIKFQTLKLWSKFDGL